MLRLTTRVHTCLGVRLWQTRCDTGFRAGERQEAFLAVDPKELLQIGSQQQSPNVQPLYIVAEKEIQKFFVLWNLILYV